MIRWIRVGEFEELTFKFLVEGPGVMDRGGGCVVIGNDGGGGKGMVRSSGGRSFQRRGAVMDNSVPRIVFSALSFFNMNLINFCCQKILNPSTQNFHCQFDYTRRACTTL